MKKEEFPCTGKLPRKRSPRQSCGISESWINEGPRGRKQEAAFSANKQLTYCGPARWQAQGTERSPHRGPAVQGSGPGCQEACTQTSAVHTNYTAQTVGPQNQRRAHKPCNIKGKLGGLREAPYKSEMQRAGLTSQEKIKTAPTQQASATVQGRIRGQAYNPRFNGQSKGLAAVKIRQRGPL